VFKGNLRPYQQEAVESMVDRGQMLLCIVMGGGKTVVTLAALEQLRQQGEIDRALIVVPASLKFQWLKEVHKFTDAKAIVIDGTPKQRQDLWRFAASAQYIIANPESLMKDTHRFDRLQLDCLVVDEATMIKSLRAQRSKFIKKLGKTCHYRFALTGQPIENRPEELFSIMQFVDPNVLGKFDQFDRTFIVRDHFGKPIRYRNLDLLRSSLTDVMVRKSREDIQDQLPQLITQVVPVPFDSTGATAYRRIASDLLTEITNAISTTGRGFNLFQHYHGNGDPAQGQIMARLTVLRMLCDNPELVRISAALYDNPSSSEGSQYASEVMKMGWLPPSCGNPKLDSVINYINDVLDEDPNNKVVLFSFFKQNLRLIQQATAKITNSVLFMGGMSAQQREDSKVRFSTDPGTRLFLSSDAGGYGVDLPIANYLISYDLPWSAGKLDQREARIIRLSSEFPHVTVASFVMAGSIEERQYEMLQEKRHINRAFIDGGYDGQGQFQLTLGSLSDFLRSSSV